MQIDEPSLGSLFKKADCQYTSCYCEENVYQLCAFFKNGIHDKLNSAASEVKYTAHAVFITNSKKKAMMKMQKIGDPKQDYLVCWDYHVIFIVSAWDKDKNLKEAFVYDLDTVLDFPSTFETYFERAFKFKKPFPLVFRVVPFELMIDYFASDRSHMMKNGKYLAPPPKYSPIVNKNGDKMNLPDYWDLKNTEEKYGLILSEKEFELYFKKK